MEAIAKMRYIRISPRKVQIVLDLIRGKDAKTACVYMMQTPKAASEPMLKLLKSAIANAENNLSLAKDDLIVTKAFVDEGPSLRRYKPRAKGRADRMVHRMSHITIAVGTREEA